MNNDKAEEIMMKCAAVLAGLSVLGLSAFWAYQMWGPK